MKLIKATLSSLLNLLHFKITQELDSLVDLKYDIHLTFHTLYSKALIKDQQNHQSLTNSFCFYTRFLDQFFKCYEALKSCYIH